LHICFIFSIPKGQVTVLVVGGALEAANSDKDCLKLVLNRRKGFVKLALRFGVDLVPTFSFGEYSIYDQVPNPVGKTLLFW
jgi:2-acylglycerol O-acyltransferase 2